MIRTRGPSNQAAVIQGNISNLGARFKATVCERLLGLWVRILRGTWMSFSYECCVLLGRGLCVRLITRPEESYLLWCGWVWSWSLDRKGGLVPLGGRGAVFSNMVYLRRYLFFYILWLQEPNIVGHPKDRRKFYHTLHFIERFIGFHSIVCNGKYVWLTDN